MTAAATQPIQSPRLMQSDLFARRWTKKMISDLYGAPDEIEERHIYRVGWITYHWYEARVEAIEASPEWQAYRAKLDARRSHAPKQLPLLDAVREISHAAHRQRDAAQKQYTARNHGLAKHSKSRKEDLYALKERGIVALHKAGDLRYAGVTPQGMAVYEYGDGGKQCFHSCLHPRGVKITQIENHPETLFVPAKQAKHKLKDAEFTLWLLPEINNNEYSRTAAPRHTQPRTRAEVVCYTCGQPGHIARECDDDNDDYRRM